MNRRRAAGWLVLACPLALAPAALAACASTVHSDARIVVTPAVSLADQPVSIQVTRLAPRERVTITSQATDATGAAWQAHGDFTADAHGTVNLATTAPTSGTYQDPSSTGLLWSMQPLVSKADNQVFFAVPPPRDPGYTVRLTVTAHGQQLASRAIQRRWLAPGETARALTLKADKVAGEVFLPPPGTPPHPGVLVFGGGEGGMRYTYTAALLAAHGYPAATVAYFDYPGLPSQLRNIPIEYFVRAGQILAATHRVDPSHLLVMGYSRGSEAALLLAQYYPNLFHGAIVYSPSAVANSAQPGPPGASWMLSGVPLPPASLLSVTHVSGPVLAFAGGMDGLWSSSSWANEINAELSQARSPYPHRSVVYIGAGHAVGTFPYEPIGTTGLLTLGGTRTADLAGQSGSWAQVLKLLASLSH